MKTKLECEHKNIESNMCPLHCTDCGKLLDEPTSSQKPKKEWKKFIAKIRKDTLEEVREKLKHIAMYHEHGDENSVLATYSVKDVLTVLE